MGAPWTTACGCHLQGQGRKAVRYIRAGGCVYPVVPTEERGRTATHQKQVGGCCGGPPFGSSRHQPPTNSAATPNQPTAPHLRRRPPRRKPTGPKLRVRPSLRGLRACIGRHAINIQKQGGRPGSAPGPTAALLGQPAIRGAYFGCRRVVWPAGGPRPTNHLPVSEGTGLCDGRRRWLAGSQKVCNCAHLPANGVFMDIAMTVPGTTFLFSTG